MTRSLRNLLAATLALSLAALACSLFQPGGGGASSTSAAPPAQSGTSIPTGVPASPVQGAGKMTLILPQGGQIELHASCAGIRPDEYLQVRATNTEDVNDTNRVLVQVEGAHQSAGEVGNMFVAIFIGPQSGWTFSGNMAAATLTLESDGSGRFTDVAIVNIAVDSPVYQYGVEYKFTAEWKCK